MIAHRTFKDYETYVHQQGAKARYKRDFLLAHLEKGTQNFQRIFTRARSHLTPGAVLCLGARTGAESLGAEAAGFVGSVGIDLHPIGPTVQQGDWHDIQFPDASFENVYCNSLDHCLYLDKMARHVARVLKPGGRFYLMASNKPDTEANWRAKGGNEALYWETSDDLAKAICGYGFTLLKSWRDGKWGHYVLKVAA